MGLFATLDSKRGRNLQVFRMAFLLHIPCNGMESQALVALWRERCLEVRRQFEIARLRVNETQRIGDANAYRDALEREGAARAEYRRVLTLYTDLLVHGRVPDEAAGQRAAAT